MAWFKKKSENVVYTRDQFQALASLDGHYGGLKAMFGQAYVTALSDIIFRQIKNLLDSARKTGIEAHRITLAPGKRYAEPRAFEQLYGAYFEKEWTNMQGRILHVTDLWYKMVRGTLRTQLAVKTEPAGNYNGIGVDHTTKAYNWVTNSWHGDDQRGKRSVRETIDYYVDRIGPTFPLGTDNRVMVDVFRRVVQDPYAANKYRGPNPMLPVKYPSDIGGRKLQNWFMETYATGYQWPPVGDEKWDDVATFFLGAIQAVQGFVDGNKRTSRVVYAILMLRAGRKFKAPTNAFEIALAQM